MLAPDVGVSARRNPITGTAARCAPAANGQNSEDPAARLVINSRRLIGIYPKTQGDHITMNEL